VGGLDGSTIARWLRALGSVERKNTKETASAFFLFCRGALSGLLCQGKRGCFRSKNRRPKGRVSGGWRKEKGGLSWLVVTGEKRVA